MPVTLFCLFSIISPLSVSKCRKGVLCALHTRKLFFYNYTYRSIPELETNDDDGNYDDSNDDDDDELKTNDDDDGNYDDSNDNDDDDDDDDDDYDDADDDDCYQRINSLIKLSVIFFQAAILCNNRKH
jgi:hypothetical protein